MKNYVYDRLHFHMVDYVTTLCDRLWLSTVSHQLWISDNRQIISKWHTVDEIFFKLARQLCSNDSFMTGVNVTGNLIGQMTIF